MDQVSKPIESTSPPDWNGRSCAAQFSARIFETSTSYPALARSSAGVVRPRPRPSTFRRRSLRGRAPPRIASRHWYSGLAQHAQVPGATRDQCADIGDEPAWRRCGNHANLRKGIAGTTICDGSIQPPAVAGAPFARFRRACVPLYSGLLACRLPFRRNLSEGPIPFYELPPFWH